MRVTWTAINAALLCLLSVQAQIEVTITSTLTQESTVIVPSRTVSYSNVTSSFSSTDGPYYDGWTLTWSQYVRPTTVGTVQVVVNSDTNRTFTTTKFNTEYSANGTLLPIFTRTDTNPAGTVTATIDAYDVNSTVAYPTPYLAYNNELSWGAILPTVWDKSSCCMRIITSVPTPTHTPFPSATGGETDSADPSGWLYTLVTVDVGVHTEFEPDVITSLWKGQSLELSYSGCPYTQCVSTPLPVAGAVAFTRQAFLFDTQTITTSGADATTEASSVVVDPITQPSKDPKPTTSDQVEISSSTSGAATSDATSAVSSTPVKATTSTREAPSSVVSTPVSSDGTSSGQDSPPPPQSQASSVVPSSAQQTTQTPERTTQNSAGTLSQTSVGSQAVPQVTSDTRPVTTIVSRPTSNVLNVPPPIASSATSVPVVSSATAPLSTSVLSSGPGASAQVPVSSNTNTVPQVPAPGTTNSAPQVPAPGTTNAVPTTPIIVGSATVSIDSSSRLIISGETLVPDTPITIGEGTSTTVIAISTQSSKTVLQVGTAVTTFQPAPAAPATNNIVPIVIGSNTIIPDTSSLYVVSGQTLVPGIPITIGSGQSSTVIAISTDSTKTVLQVGTSASIIQAPPAAPSQVTPAPIVIGSNTILPGSSSQYIVSGQTLVPGSAVLIGSGQSTTLVSLSAGPSETVLQVETSVSTIQAPPSVPSQQLAPIVIGSNTIVPDSSSQYVVAGQTLLPGSSIVLGSGESTILVALSTGASETILQVGSSFSTITAYPAVTSAPAPPIVVGSDTILAGGSSQYVIDGQTLTPGSSITIGTGSSTTILALSTGSFETVLQVGSSISTINAYTAATSIRAPPIIIIGSSTILANDQSEYIIGTQTLNPGSSITIGTGSSTTLIALQTSGTQNLFVVGTSTSTLQSQPRGSGGLPPITAGTTTVTPILAGDYVFGTQTLSPGGPGITVDGQSISLASGAGQLVVGTKTESLVMQTDGGYVWSEVGNSSTAATISSSRTSRGLEGSGTATGVQTGNATGEAGRREQMTWVGMVMGIMGVFVL